MTFKVDPEAKSKVELTRQRDKEGHSFYIGKLQFPGTLEFDKGASFMIFLSDDGFEELQIAPLDPTRKPLPKRHRETAGVSGGRFSIDLHPMVDKDGETYYIGEALGPVSMKLRKGIFFHVFTSRPGVEELQISQLNHDISFRKKHSYQRIEKSPQGWTPKLADVM